MSSKFSTDFDDSIPDFLPFTAIAYDRDSPGYAIDATSTSSICTEWSKPSSPSPIVARCSSARCGDPCRSSVELIEST
ncbi:hypothetical protein V6N11_063367 [Hibiscus sabdariffa]|uniref:Uncharacterized protein n=2 Tax=Hibiscus sabdariffa TaxID=183260 RepID=A0ABR1Z9K5_9ROSI